MQNAKCKTKNARSEAAIVRFCISHFAFCIVPDNGRLTTFLQNRTTLLTGGAVSARRASWALVFLIPWLLGADDTAPKPAVTPLIRAKMLMALLALVMLGILAPVALVFAFAVAPIAFGLACAGAWVGRA